MDTGASHTLLSTTFATSQRFLLSTSSFSHVTAADGRHLPVMGTAHFTLHIGEAHIDIAVPVANITYEMILGVDVLHRLRVSLNFNGSSPRLSSPLLPTAIQLHAHGSRTAISTLAPPHLPSSISSVAHPEEPTDLVPDPLPFSDLRSSWTQEAWTSARDAAITSASLSHTDKSRLRNLLDEFQDLFSVPATPPGTADVPAHHIPTPTDAQPLVRRNRRVAPAEHTLIATEVSRMLAAGVIRPSSSPWCSPVVPVRKPDGSLRFCVDYRALNAITTSDVYPLPHIRDIFDSLGGNSLFTTLDLAAGYWQVPMDPNDAPKTAFATPAGLFEFSVMPFGLKNAPASFQRMMDSVLRNLGPETVSVYIDDLISPARFPDDFFLKLRRIFDRLRSYRLHLRLDKCQFARSSLRFLGHMVTADGIAVDPDKIDALNRLPAPSTVSAVRQFLGMASYYRAFIRDFATIAAPLTALTRKYNRFYWTQDCQQAFDTLIHLLSSPPILAFPDFSRPFHLTTDASHTALGAILSQPDDRDGHDDRVICYASRQLTSAERRYPVTELETLAAVWGVRYFRPYLLGPAFTIFTDHRALQWLHSPSASLSDRLQRWALALQPYDFRIVYRPGSQLQHVDALSRLTVPAVTALSSGAPVNLVPTHVDAFIAAQDADPIVGPLRQFLRNGSLPSNESQATTVRSAARSTRLDSDHRACLHQDDGTLRLYVPTSMRSDLLRAAHDDPVSGHLAAQRSYDRLLPLYFWPNMYTDVFNWCHSCTICSRRITPRTAPPGFLQPLSASYPWQLVEMDYLGPLPTTTAGNRYVLIFVDHFSKWVEAVASPTADAAVTARSLVDRIICRFGSPTTLLSDRGSHFTAQLVSAVCSWLHIDRRTSTAYHPQTQGLVERFNATLTDMLAKFTNTDQRNWDEYLNFVVWAYNSSTHASTGLSPFEVLFGYRPVSPLDAALQPPALPTSSSAADHLHRLSARLAVVRDLVLGNSAAARHRQQNLYNAHHRFVMYDVGSEVYLHTPQPRRGLTPKLQSLWTGPWTVLERVNDVNYLISKPGSARQLVSISRLKPAHTRASRLIPPTSSPPQPIPSPAPIQHPPTVFPPPPPAYQRSVLLPPVPVDAAPNDPVQHPPPPPNPIQQPQPQPHADHPQPRDLPPGYYIVDRLLDRQPAGRGFRYQVRWENYGPEDDTWEPRRQLPQHLVDDYDRTHPFPNR